MQRLLSMSNAPNRRRRGLSLVEVIVSMLLVGILLVGSLRSVGGVFRAWDASQRIHDRTGLAQQLMSEILQQHYEDPNAIPLLGIEGLELSTDRSLWNDVDDYHGWSAAPETKDGTPLAGFDAWRRSVSVEIVRITSPTQVSLLDQGLKRITVRVSDPSGRQTVLIAYRSRWGMLEESPYFGSTSQTYVGQEMQIGTGAKLHAGGHLLNDAGRP